MTVSTVHGLFVGLGNSAVGQLMRASLLAVPFAVIVHLLGLILLGGTTLLVTLSVWGVVVRQPAPARVAGELWPFAVTGLALTVVTGLLLVSANADYYYESTVFWAKLALLVPAIVVAFIVQRHVCHAGERPLARRWKVASGLNFLLWTSVAIAGRAIGLL